MAIISRTRSEGHNRQSANVAREIALRAAGDRECGEHIVGSPGDLDCDLECERDRAGERERERELHRARGKRAALFLDHPVKRKL